VHVLRRCEYVFWSPLESTGAGRLESVPGVGASWAHVIRQVVSFRGFLGW
jgi:hypothetical protein